MCGIVGTVSFSRPVQTEQLVAARDLLAARGPDDSGVWCEDTVGLGHRRLAILEPEFRPGTSRCILRMAAMSSSTTERSTTTGS